jgi:hypothetical protein
MLKLLRVVWVGHPLPSQLHIIIVIITVTLRITTSETEGGVEGIRKCAHLSPNKCPNHGKHTVTFLVNDQLDEQLFFMYLFKFSTFSEQPRAHHQENQCINTTSGICHPVWVTVSCAGRKGITVVLIVRQVGNLPRVITRCAVDEI